MKICLIVDESPVIRKIAARIVEQAGFETLPLESHEAALAHIAEKGAPALAILSASISDNAGVDLVRAVKSAPGGREAVVVASIVEANLGLLTRLKRASSDELVYKPFDRPRLMASIMSAMVPKAA